MTEQATLDDKLDQLIDSIDGLRPLLEELARNALTTCNEPPAAWLDSDDVAVLLHVSRSTLYYWRYNDQGPAWFKVGKRIRYDRAALETWRAEQGAER